MRFFFFEFKLLSLLRSGVHLGRGEWQLGGILRMRLVTFQAGTIDGQNDLIRRSELLCRTVRLIGQAVDLGGRCVDVHLTRLHRLVHGAGRLALYGVHMLK